MNDDVPNVDEFAANRLRFLAEWIRNRDEVVLQSIQKEQPDVVITNYWPDENDPSHPGGEVAQDLDQIATYLASVQGLLNAKDNAIDAGHQLAEAQERLVVSGYKYGYRLGTITGQTAMIFLFAVVVWSPIFTPIFTVLGIVSAVASYKGKQKAKELGFIVDESKSSDD